MVTSIFSFSHDVFKSFYFRGVKSRGCVVEGSGSITAKIIHAGVKMHLNLGNAIQILWKNFDDGNMLLCCLTGTFTWANFTITDRVSSSQ